MKLQLLKSVFYFLLLIFAMGQTTSCKNQAPESAPADEAPVEAAPVEEAPMSEQEIDEFEKEVMPEIPGGYKNKLLKKSLFKNMKTYGDVEYYLDSILSIGGFETNKRFLVDGGFGIASDVENIMANGNSESGNKRFDTSFDLSKSTGSWLENFLYPRIACRTRMFVFIFSNKPFQNKPDEQLTLETIREWVDLGFTSLPYEIRNKIINNSYNLNVLVYEYEVTDVNSKGKLNKSGLSVIDHLKKAKLWQQEMGL